MAVESIPQLEHIEEPVKEPPKKRQRVAKPKKPLREVAELQRFQQGLNVEGKRKTREKKKPAEEP